MVPPSSLRTTRGYAPAKSVLGSRYWIGGYGSTVGEAGGAGDALAGPDGLGKGAGVAPAGGDGDGESVAVAGPHAMVRTDARVMYGAARWLTPWKLARHAEVARPSNTAQLTRCT